jgi:hypothetical protein
MAKFDEKFKVAVDKGYYVDEHGDVYSKYKKLSLSLNNSKYYFFTIRVNKIRTVILVHRFVAYLKYGNIIFEDDIVVRHLNNNSMDNSYENIDIGTQSDNMRDISLKNRTITSIKVSSYKRRFTDEEVTQILYDRKNGFTYKKICEKYNTSKSTLSYLFNNSYYSGVKNIENL